VEPTKHAEELYPIVRTAFVQLLNAENIVLEFNEKSQGEVRLNLSLYFMPQLAGPIIANFTKTYPNIKMMINSATITEGADAIERHESDIFLFAYWKTIPFKTDGLTVIELMEIENCLFASESYLKQNGLGTTITKEQLQNLTIMSYPYSSQAGKAFYELATSKDALVETNSTQMLISLAENNAGIILAPDGLVGDDLVKVKVTGIESPRFNIALAYNNELANKAGSAFIATIKDKIKK